MSNKINNTTEELTMKDDVIFKAFFSKKGNKKFLKSFLESILKESLEIKKIVHDSNLEQLSRKYKHGILDLEVELKTGEIVNIELQRRNLRNIEKRTTFYAAKKIAEQIEPGEDYSKIRRVIVIAILDYSIVDLPEYFIKTERIIEGHSDYKINNEVQYYYIELNKFRKANPDMDDLLNQWIAFIDRERGDLLKMAKKKNELLQEAECEYKVLTGKEKRQRMAFLKAMDSMEEIALRKVLKEEAKEEAKKEAREEVRKEIKEEVKEEIKEKVKNEIKDETKIEIARNMLKENFSIKQISKITNLTEEEIQKLS